MQVHVTVHRVGVVRHQFLLSAFSSPPLVFVLLLLGHILDHLKVHLLLESEDKSYIHIYVLQQADFTASPPFSGVLILHMMRQSNKTKQKTIRIFHLTKTSVYLIVFHSKATLRL